MLPNVGFDPGSIAVADRIDSQQSPGDPQSAGVRADTREAIKPSARTTGEAGREDQRLARVSTFSAARADAAGLGRSATAIQLAGAANDRVLDILDDARALATAASVEGLSRSDRDALEAEFAALRQEIDDVARNSRLADDSRSSRGNERQVAVERGIEGRAVKAQAIKVRDVGAQLGAQDDEAVERDVQRVESQSLLNQVRAEAQESADRRDGAAISKESARADAARASERDDRAAAAKGANDDAPRVEKHEVRGDTGRREAARDDTFSASDLGLVGIDLDDPDGAVESLARVEKAVERVAANRSRLSSARANIDEAASSVGDSLDPEIRRSDRAREAAERVVEQIQTQPGLAALATGNAAPVSVLNVLVGT